MKGRHLLDPEQVLEEPPTTMSLKVGDKFPEGIQFSYIPWTQENESATSCGIPINYDASEEWKDKKVVLFAVPGAFTPGCSVSLPDCMSFC